MGHCESSQPKEETNRDKGYSRTHNKRLSNMTKTKSSNNNKNIVQNKIKHYKYFIISSILKNSNKIIIENKEFEVNSTFDFVIKEIYSKLNPYSDYKFEYEYKKDKQEKESKLYNLIITNTQDSLINIFSYDNHYSHIIIYVTYIGLNIPNEVNKGYINSSFLIGSPIIDNKNINQGNNNTETEFNIIIYNKLENNLSLKSILYSNLNDNIISLLSNLSHYSSYCNGNNSIYFSGGLNINLDKNINPFNQLNNFFSQTQQFQLNSFFSIELTTLNVKILPNLLSDRSWHNSIFIPNQYIFVISGLHNKSVDVFDIETNTWKTDSELNEIRCECSSCLINDTYLYVFCGFLHNFGFINSIERCNLRKEKHNWDVVNYYYNDNGIEFFQPCFFPIVNNNKNNCLYLLGNSEINSKFYNETNLSYLFEYGCKNKEKLTNMKREENLIGIFPEKFAFPINNEDCIIMTMNIGYVTTLYKLNYSDGNVKEIIMLNVKDVIKEKMKTVTDVNVCGEDSQ